MKDYFDLLESSYDFCTIDHSWYEKIRFELIKKIISKHNEILDIGTHQGDTLIKLSKYYKKAIGIDIAQNEIIKAISNMKKYNIHNIDFIHSDILENSFERNAFDFVMIIGDVLSYPNLYDKQNEVIQEIYKLLKPNSIVIYDGTNWDWEYKESQNYSFFKKSNDDNFTFHITDRNKYGKETARNYEVCKNTALYDWLKDQKWAINPSGFDTSLDIEYKKSFPDGWLIEKDVQKSCYYNIDSIKKLFKDNGFKEIKAFAYGQTCDIINKAKLIKELEQYKDELSKAEADLVFNLQLGAGPWLFLIAKKQMMIIR